LIIYLDISGCIGLQRTGTAQGQQPPRSDGRGQRRRDREDWISSRQYDHEPRSITEQGRAV